MTTQNTDMALHNGADPYAPAALIPTGVDVGTDSHAAAQREIIRARVVLALQRPRDIERSRQLILVECRRPRFAKFGGGLYKVPGKGSGLSIRFAEAAFRAMGNMHADVQVTREDARYRYLVVSVMDLETNSTHSLPVTVPKIVERRDPKDREVISQRTNSRNQTVFTVEATEDELLTLQNNMLAKARRNLILAHVPGDIQDEAEEVMLATQRERDAADPKAAMREVLDAFDRLNVPADEVREFLGKPVDQASAPDLARLRDVWQAVVDGVDWRDVLNTERARRGERQAATPAGSSQPAKPASKVGGGILGELQGKGKPAAEEPKATEEPAAPSDDEPPLEAPGDLAAPSVDQADPLGGHSVDHAPAPAAPRTTPAPAPAPTPAPVEPAPGRTEAGGYTDDAHGLHAAMATVWTHGRTYKDRTLQEIIDDDAGLKFLVRQANGTRMAEEAPELHAAAQRVVTDPILQTDVEGLGD